MELMKHGIAVAEVSGFKEPIQGYRSFSLGFQHYKAVMTPDFAKRQFDDVVTADKIQSCSTIRRNSNDILHREWLLQAFSFETELDAHIIPSSQGILVAVMKGVAWAVVPSNDVDTLIEAGDLVELISGKSLRKPIYWHYCCAISDALKPINDSVIAAAHKNLEQPDQLHDAQTIMIPRN